MKRSLLHTLAVCAGLTALFAYAAYMVSRYGFFDSRTSTIVLCCCGLLVIGLWAVFFSELFAARRDAPPARTPEQEKRLEQLTRRMESPLHADEDTEPVVFKPAEKPKAAPAEEPEAEKTADTVPSAEPVRRKRSSRKRPEQAVSAPEKAVSAPETPTAPADTPSAQELPAQPPENAAPEAAPASPAQQVPAKPPAKRRKAAPGAKAAAHRPPVAAVEKTAAPVPPEDAAAALPAQSVSAELAAAPALGALAGDELTPAQKQLQERLAKLEMQRLNEEARREAKRLAKLEQARLLEEQRRLAKEQQLERYRESRSANPPRR